MITVHSGQVLLYFTESLLLFGCLPSVGEAVYQTISTLSHLITIAGLLFLRYYYHLHEKPKLLKGQIASRNNINKTSYART